MEGTTLLYAAPEVVSLESRQELDLKSDVYSFGITMCELMTRQLPYIAVVKDIPALNTVMDATYNEQSLLAAICHSHLRPPMKQTRFDNVNGEIGVLTEWKILIEKCWSPDKSARPMMKDVYQELNYLIQELGIKVTDDRSALLAEDEHLEQRMGSSTLHSKQVKIDFSTPPPLEIVGLQLQDPKPLSIGSFATSGRRGPDKMEDRHTVTTARLSDSGLCVTVIVVLDGHGGQGAASFAMRELGPAIHHELRSTAIDADHATEAIKKAFVTIDARFQVLHSDDTSGSTALAVVIFTQNGSIKSIIVANAGDCRAVLAEKLDNVYRPRRLTNDHNADQVSERRRIEALGAKIFKDPQGNNRIEGHLQVTRSLGDNAMKRCGVIAEPEIDVIVPTPGIHDFMVIGTDGLFDFMTDKEVINGVLDTAKEPGLSSKRLGSESIAKGSTDNVTSVVVFMREWDPSGKPDWKLEA